MCPLLLQEEQEARVKGFAVARFRKRPEIDPSGRLRMAMWPLRGRERRNVALFHAIEKCYFMRFVFTYIHHLGD